MAEKKNDYLAQQKRRRRELLELKNAEEMPRPEKEEEIPKTFKEKAANFWYHNKWGAIGVAALLLVVAICAFQMVSKPKYDCRVVVYLGDFIDKPTREALEAELEKFCPDVNGDGEVNVLAIDCCIYENMQTNQLKNALDRVQAQLMDPECVLYVVDDDTIQQLDSSAPEIFENLSFPALSGRGIPLGGTELDKAVQAADTVDTLDGEYYIALRHFNPNNFIQPEEKDIAAAKAILENLAAEN